MAGIITNPNPGQIPGGLFPLLQCYLGRGRQAMAAKDAVSTLFGRAESIWRSHRWTCGRCCANYHSQKNDKLRKKQKLHGRLIPISDISSMIFCCHGWSGLYDHHSFLFSFLYQFHIKNMSSNVDVAGHGGYRSCERENWRKEKSRCNRRRSR